MTSKPAARSRGREAGQILPLFVLSMVVVLAAGALLLDGASMLVTRRHLQNAGDSAALAGANTMQADGTARTCSTTSGPPPGAARADIVAAVQASVAANYPGFPTANISVTCPNGWENAAVQVDLNLAPGTFLSRAIGYAAPNVQTSSTAVNGAIAGSLYNVVLLDNSNSSWPNGRRGCPAFLISGGPTITFDGSVMIDSACTAANGGALASNGSSASLTMGAGRTINMVGGYSLGPLVVTPPPVTGATAVPDPLADIEAMSTTGMTVRSSSKLVLNNVTQVLQPGIYNGGIELRNSSIALLRPGIYVIDGGGLDVGSQASLCSISSTSTATNCLSFSTDCPDTTCGVLLYNKGTSNGSNAMGQIKVGAGATLKMRAYDDRAMSGAHFEWRNMLFWQASTPAASSSYAQPILELSGGGTVDISGTVYAPQAKVMMGGGSGGSGGTTTNLTLQFIAWDLEMSGNSTFRFYYSNNDFVRPKDYGLVK